MEFLWGFVALLAALVAIVGIVVWRVSTTANRGIEAFAGAANSVVDAAKPITTATGHVIHGVGDVTNAVGDIVQSFADNLRKKQRERSQLMAENESLHAQIEQLRGRRVSATAVERQLQLAFFSIQSKYTSFRNVVTPSSAGGVMGFDRPTSEQFLGVVEADFTAKVGVDVRKLQFALAGESTVYVYGAHHVQPIGLTDIKLNTLFHERRRILHETKARDGAVEIVEGKGELATESLKHRDDVLAEIQNSSVTSALAEVNERVTLGFFQAFMGGGRHQFVAAREALEQPLTFEQVCTEINSQVSRHIEKLEARKAQTIERARELDDEILQVALQARAPELVAGREEALAPS
ncbi:MAG: hypothetical protein K0S57_94 [Ramlibacter sp.]|jgi:cell division protein FtsB|nr:hypothetical protein [Ramlibacter sp.]